MGLCLSMGASMPPSIDAGPGQALEKYRFDDRSLGAYERGLGQQEHASSAGVSPRLLPSVT